MSSSTLYLPAIPPFSALRASKYALFPAVSGLPMAATRPLVGVITPRRIVVPSKPGTVAGASPSWLEVSSLFASSSSPPPQAATANDRVRPRASGRNQDRFTVFPPVVVGVVGDRPQYENGHVASHERNR